MKRYFVAAALVGALMVPAGAAAVKHVSKTAKKTAVKEYWICKECGVYYTPAEAKQRGYKCGMGHVLVKSASIPKGFGSGPREGM